MKKWMMAATAVALVMGGVGLSVAQPARFDFEKLKGRPILNQTPTGTSGVWTLEKILSMTAAEQEALWRTLPPPTVQEMNGSYMGLGPMADNPEAQKAYAAYMYDEKSVRGAWQGKAFRPVGPNAGEGYNRWRFPGARIVRNLRMTTSIGPSLIDGKPAYILNYPAMNPGNTLVDELRKVDDGVYIGAATTAQPGGPINGTRSAISMFFMLGPTDEWVGGPYGGSAPRPAATPAQK